MVEITLELNKYKIDCLRKYAKDLGFTLDETIDLFTSLGIREFETVDEEIIKEVEKRYNK
jgi:hypothetical protein